jgi:uncharacterized protein YkwD
MTRFVVFVLSALVLAPAALAAPRTDADGGLVRDSSSGAAAQALVTNSQRLAWKPATAVGVSSQQKALETGLVRAINSIRSEHGLKPLAFSAKLAAAAAQHTREMGTKGYFEHESYDSSEFWKRIERWYPSRAWRSWSVGENLLSSSPDVTVSDGLETWMDSPPHRANLLSRSWREIGLSAIHFESAPGEFEDGPVTLVTADFGARR